MTPETLAVCTGSTLANARIYVEPLTFGMDRFKISASPLRMACFLGTVAIESSRLRRVEEDLYYTTPDRLREIFPSLFGPKGQYKAENYLRDPVQLSLLRYRGYHGRGLIQLTWLDAYKAASAALGADYVTHPQLVEQPEHAALTACWFFAVYKSCLPDADAGDMYTITGKVQGPARLQLAERKAQMGIALNSLGGSVQGVRS